MKLLELFSGSGIISKTFKDAGHEVMTLDFIEKFNPDICCDVLDFKAELLNGFVPDVIWASPECKCCSTASIGTHWIGGKKTYIPKTEAAKTAIKVFDKTVEIIQSFDCIGWVENPRCVTRKLDSMKRFESTHPRHTIWYCKYGDIRAKPEDIWTNCNNWIPRPPCKNKRNGVVNNCHHEAAPRGSKTGTQGLKNHYERSKIPEALCLEILEATEDAYNSSNR